MTMRELAGARVAILPGQIGGVQRVVRIFELVDASGATLPAAVAPDAAPAAPAAAPAPVQGGAVVTPVR